MDKYAGLLKYVWKELKSQKFKQKGSNFYLFDEDNIGVINFQRMGNSNLGPNTFTINLGVSSSKIREIEDRRMDELPTTSECHWRRRIGFLMPENRDHWWKIDSIGDISSFSEEIINLLRNLAIPEIKKNISDKNLLENFKVGNGQGISESEKWRYLIVLLSFYDRNSIDQFVIPYWKYAIENRLLVDARFYLERLGIPIPK